MDDKTKIIIKRAAMTFAEGFVATAAAMAYMFDGVADAGALRAALVTVGGAAIAAGMSAAWNVIIESMKGGEANGD